MTQAPAIEKDAPIQPVLSKTERPRVCGKFLYADGAKLQLRGVTYGPFRPTDDGCEYHTPDQVEHDFQQMRRHGINTVRVYTVPPRWLLDIAGRHGLRVLIGLPWEQHISFLQDARTRDGIEQRIREGVRACADHAAVLGFAVGNEIPAPMVRWYGKRRVERFIKRLFRAVKDEDPQALVTYVNYPTTEYLDLSFLDFVCFNVYLEDERTLRRYLSRLHNLAGSLPLVMGEVGLDSQRNGREEQAETLRWQLRTCLSAGCAGIYVFAWTDEWHRGGFDIEDWDFGLTDRRRQPKPALRAVSEAFRQGPLDLSDPDLPLVSVVVCTYNGSATIAETCRRMTDLTYPKYELLVVDDGSTDGTGDMLDQLVEQYPRMRVIHVANGGLSSARNVGMREARGQIVAYTDDDAFPDPDWLTYAVNHLLSTNHVGVGGPNLPVPEDCDTAACVAHSPGGPNHVLITDRVAEHIPGCNMVFWKGALESVAGFDPQFRIAGDDVDLCWRLQEKDGVIGFHPTAFVWHHRRREIRGYLKQQTNYGRAEAMLERKWPGKYNQFGHVRWTGRVYGDGLTLPLLHRSRIYHGVWGTGLFQSIYRRPASVLQSIPLMPEWYLLIAAVAVAALPGILWQPYWFLLPLAALAVGVPLAQAITSAYSARLDRSESRWQRLKCRATIAALHIAQPIVRLKGRVLQGLAPWKRTGWHRRMAFPRRRVDAFWSETWKSPEQRLGELETALAKVGIHPERGGDFDRWDLQLHGGMFGGIRTLMTIEEHGGGRQMVRLKVWPVISTAALIGLALAGVLIVLAVALLHTGAVVLLTTFGVCLLVRALGDCASAMGGYDEATRTAERHLESVDHDTLPLGVRPA